NGAQRNHRGGLVDVDDSMAKSSADSRPSHQTSSPAGPVALRFVVLRHDLPGADHWDLMFEEEGALVTWRPQVPLAPIGETPFQIEQIGAQRMADLDYEGPVSGNRGRVERHERGEYALLSRGPSEWRVDVRGEQTVGRFRLWQPDRGNTGWRIMHERQQALIK